MDVDQDRKLVLISRDPRSYAGSTTPRAGEATRTARRTSPASTSSTRSDPDALRLLAFQQLPTGHTTTCINRCRWLWTGGPAATTTQQQAAAELDRSGGR